MPNEVDLCERPRAGEKFKDQTILFDGGGVDLTGCDFDGCRFVFTGAAANTLAFIQALYRSGGCALIEELFEAIRQGKAGDGERPIQ